MTVFIETFPVLVAFDNLDMLESLQIAKKALYGLSGIYGFVHKPGREQQEPAILVLQLIWEDPEE
jgi:hypothetical protein